MDDKSLFRQGAICDVNPKNSPTQTGPCVCAFALSTGRRTTEYQRILLLSKKNLKIMLDFNLVL